MTTLQRLWVVPEISGEGFAPEPGGIAMGK